MMRIFFEFDDFTCFFLEVFFLLDFLLIVILLSKSEYAIYYDAVY